MTAPVLIARRVPEAVAARARAEFDAVMVEHDLDAEELAIRRAAWTPPEARFERGYGWMFTKHIQQADEGCDFDFLRTDHGAPVPEPVIY